MIDKLPDAASGAAIYALGAPELARIAARIFDTPLLIHEGKLHQILQVLGPRLGIDLQQRVELPATAGPAAHSLARGPKWEWDRDGRYHIVGPVAVIPVLGTLVQRSGYLDSLSGLMSYDRIERSLEHAIANYDVAEIVLDYDTAGGEAAGAFDSADRIASMRGAKPMTAVVNELAASAGFLLASTADRIVIPRTGYAGSVGVVTAHADYSKQLEKRGIVVTLIYAGEKKVDGNPYEPLPERVRAEVQGEVDEMYRIFVETVARNRKISADVVQGTQAGMFMGRAALETGFADEVNTLSNVLSNSLLRRGGAFRLITMGSTTMTDAERAERDKAVAEARAEGVAQGKREAQAERDQAVKDAKAEGIREGKADAAKAERERIKSIFGSEEAKGRSELASHLAFETDQSADAAIALLKAAPKAAAKGPLSTAMDALGTPGIRSSESSTERREQPKIDSAAIFGKLNAPYERAIGARASEQPLS